MKPVTGLKYVIKDTVDLNGKLIHLSENSKLVFKSGKLVNGIIEGNNSKIISKGTNIFGNCQIIGHWNVDCAYSRMFDTDLETLQLLRNLCKLSTHVKLSANRDYHLTANGEIVYLEILEGEGEDKPLLQFHTIDPNINGLNICGNTVVLRNLSVTDDYSPTNDDVYGPNDERNGSTIGVFPIDKKVQSLLVDDCIFSGGTSSSYIASSKVIKCTVENSAFSGYIGDHAVYCSVSVESFVIRNCSINNVRHSNGIFKIRSSKGIKNISLKDLQVHNLNGYLAFLSLLDTPELSIEFDNIHVSKDEELDYVFHGFCISDETQALSKDYINANQILIHNSSFYYGYNGNPLIYPGSGNAVRTQRITYDRIEASESNFGGGITDELIVSNSVFTDCCGNQGIPLIARRVLIKNTELNNHNSFCSSIFLVNNTASSLGTIDMKRVIINAKSTYLFRMNEERVIHFRIDGCYFKTLSRNVFYAPSINNVDYIIKNSNIEANESYDIFSRIK